MNEIDIKITLRVIDTRPLLDISLLPCPSRRRLLHHRQRKVDIARTVSVGVGLPLHQRRIQRQTMVSGHDHNHIDHGHSDYQGLEDNQDQPQPRRTRGCCYICFRCAQVKQPPNGARRRQLHGGNWDRDDARPAPIAVVDVYAEAHTGHGDPETLHHCVHGHHTSNHHTRRQLRGQVYSALHVHIALSGRRLA